MICTLPLVDSFAKLFKEVKEAQELNKKVCGNCYNYECDGYVFVDERVTGLLPIILQRTFDYRQYLRSFGLQLQAIVGAGNDRRDDTA